MSSTNRGRLAYLEMTGNCNTKPQNPTLQILRFNTSDLAYKKNTVESGELDSSGMTADVPEVSASSGGSINFEWSAGTYDDFLEAVFRNNWSTGISAVGSVSVVAATKTISHATAFAGATAGSWILLSGMVAGESYAGAGDSPNNGWFEVLSTAAGKVVVKDPASKLVDETGGANSRATGKCLKNGTVSRCFGLEESFLDTKSFLLFMNQVLGTMSMSVTTGSIATGTFGFMGSDVLDEQDTTANPLNEPSWLGSGNRVPAGAAPVLNATSNVGQVLIDGALGNACFQSIDMNVDNNLREIPCLGKKFPRIEYGKQSISGTIKKTFVDLAMWRAMKDHRDISLSFGFISADKQHGIHVFLPRVTLSSDQVDLSGGNNSDVFDNLDWTALRYTPATGTPYHVQICVA